MTDQAATWVYAVVPAAAAEPPPGLTGVAGEPVRMVRTGDLAAVVGSVPRTLVGEEPLREQLSDPEWLEHAVRTHHQVVTVCFTRAATVPFRLATVFDTDERVGELLREREATLRNALDRVTGRAEWGVQAYAGVPPDGPEPADQRPEPPEWAEPDRSDQPDQPDQSEQPEQPDQPDQPARPGTEYLLRRRAQRDRRQRARAAATAAAQRLDAALVALAVAVHRAPPAARTGDEQPGTMVLNASYLVDQADAAEFSDALEKLAEQQPSLRVRVTGPWPAYSFVSGEAGA